MLQREFLDKLSSAICQIKPAIQKPTSRSLLSISIHGWTVKEPFLLISYLQALRGLFQHIDNCRVSGLKGTETTFKRWSILSSPFIHKAAFTQFEQRHHKCSLICYNLSEKLYSKLLWYVAHNSPPNVHFYFKLYYHR